jgi:hypothetical protein
VDFLGKRFLREKYTFNFISSNVKISRLYTNTEFKISVLFRFTLISLALLDLEPWGT